MCYVLMLPSAIYFWIYHACVSFRLFYTHETILSLVFFSLKRHLLLECQPFHSIRCIRFFFDFWLLSLHNTFKPNSCAEKKWEHHFNFKWDLNNRFGFTFNTAPQSTAEKKWYVSLCQTTVCIRNH